MAKRGWQMLDCSVCDKGLKKPRLLPCQHTFCHTCLNQCVEKQPSKETLPCPVCHESCKLPAAGVDGLPQNTFASNLIEKQNGSQDNSSIVQHCSADPGKCMHLANVYCSNCQVFMCVQCERIHKAVSFTRNHKVTPVEKPPKQGLVSAQARKPPSCPTHINMCLDLYCEVCQVPTCNRCAPQLHAGHTCVSILGKLPGFQCQLSLVLAQTDTSLLTLRKSLQSSNQQAAKVKADVEGLKQQATASYQEIQNHLKQEQEKHLSQIDEAYQDTHKLMQENIDKQQKRETILTSIKMYGEKLKQEGTAYDITTNLKPLIEKSEEDANTSLGPELKCTVDVKWSEWKRKGPANGVKLISGVGGLQAGVFRNSRASPMATLITEHQGSNIAGMVLHNDHLFVVHFAHAVLYVYRGMRGLENMINVPGLIYPQGLCIQHGGGSTHLVICDRIGKSLWWISLEEQGGELMLGRPYQQRLQYQPWEASTHSSGHALVADYTGSCLYTYSRPDKLNICVQLSYDVTPCLAVCDAAKGYLLKDKDNKLVRVSALGNVTHQYIDYTPVSASDMVRVGTDWLVADCDNHCVHVVSGEGMHEGYLLSLQDGLRKPRQICADVCAHRLYVAHKGHDEQVQVMEAEYIPIAAPPPKVNLSVTLPKLAAGLGT